ncbi:WAT1-related protein At5g40240-like [Bidens hawaiensis]|uniref:WAT1-related protein At5g40240-like n=1 Tax=Bidens hawaiensis TaxID=980011 RepID=UPI004049B14A
MRRTGSWMDDVVPFVVMLMITSLDMAVLTIVKSAMNDGMDGIIYIIYRNSLGTLILLPFFILHILRNVDRPPLTIRILFRFFILGLLGICLFELLSNLGVSYSSPTMASAISNLSPGVTFLIAVFFRMEKLDIRSSNSIAKLLGTIMAISGAMVFIFYQGPKIFQRVGSSSSPDQLALTQPSEWILGGLLIITGGFFGCIWSVLQTATTREYPDHQTIVFFYCLFGIIQCIALSPFLVQNRSAWVLQHGHGVIVIVLGAVYSVVCRINALTWCLEKKGPVFVATFSPLSIVISVIMGIIFLDDSLYLGSIIGATAIAAGFYMVIWGQAKEKNKISRLRDGDLDVLDESAGSSAKQTVPLISSRNETEC